MVILTKQNLMLIGSAGSLQALLDAIVKRMYWSVATIPQQESERYCSKLGICYDISNANGVVQGMVVICGRKGRWSLYRIKL